jgi:DNA-binding PadR family transcriptional regulator
MNSLAALSDPTRQRIVEMLASGALSSGEIASRFDLIYELNQEGVEELAQWIAQVRAFWNPKLDALEAALRKEP